MKKILLIALIAALLLTGCGASGRTEPPRVEVTHNGQTVTATLGSSNWSYEVDGEQGGFDADSDLPFYGNGPLPAISVGENLTVELTFEEAPTKVTVIAFATEHQGDFANPSVFEELKVTDNTVTLPDDFGYILKIGVTWNLTNAKGYAEYYVQIAD